LEKEGALPQYLLVHDVIEYPETQDEWIGLWRAIRSKACGEVSWLHSFYEPESRRLFCQWQAPDLESIKSCLAEDVLRNAPIISSSEIVLFDVAWLDEGED
jgi:hypothetical protein